MLTCSGSQAPLTQNVNPHVSSLPKTGSRWVLPPSSFPGSSGWRLSQLCRCPCPPTGPSRKASLLPGPPSHLAARGPWWSLFPSRMFSTLASWCPHRSPSVPPDRLLPLCLLSLFCKSTTQGPACSLWRSELQPPRDTLRETPGLAPTSQLSVLPSGCPVTPPHISGSVL